MSRNSQMPTIVKKLYSIIWLSCDTNVPHLDKNPQILDFDNEEELIERLDQAILDVIDNPKQTQKTTAIGTLFWKTL